MTYIETLRRVGVTNVAVEKQ